MSERARGEDLREGFDLEERPQRESVGAMLARARLELGQELADVAANLRIRRVYLEAIEEGRYAELPGATYAVGFVRSYADYLGLDPDFLVERFKSEIAGLERQQALQFPAPKPEGRIPGGALVVISLLLIALAYGGWYYARENRLLDTLLPQEGELPSAEVPDAPETSDTRAPGTSAPRSEVAPVGPPPEQVAEALQEDATPQDPPTPQSSAADADVQVFTEGLVEAEEQPLVETPEPPLIPAEEGAQPAAPRTAPVSQSVPTAETVGPPARPETAAPAGAEPAAEATPERAAEAGAETAARAAGEVAEPAGAPAAADGRAEIAAAATETMEPDIPAAPELPSVVAEATGRVYGAGNADSRITLKATADSWVQVRSADDNLLITRVLRAGDVYRVPNQEGLTLETGNAGGLEIAVDGRTVPSLGRPGDVLRGVALEPQALLAGRPAAQ